MSEPDEGHEHHEVHFHPLQFLFGTPEQVAEQRRQADLAAMQNDALQHDMFDWMMNLDAESAKKLKLLVRVTAGDRSFGPFIEGQLSAMLKLKHDVCTVCGRDHDPSALVDGADLPTPHMDYAPPVVPEEDDPRGNTPAEDAAAYAQNMEVWGMRPPTPSEVAGMVIDEGELPVFCINCGMLYQSLEDRMLREPGIGGCPGCRHKSAHG